VLVRSRRTTLLAGLLLPIIGAAVLCALASIWPVRFDARSLQDLSRVQGLGLPQSSGEFIFFSRDNSIESARTATFGLRQLAFPDGNMFWAALKEHCNGPWSSGFLAIDATGNAFLVSGGAHGEWQWAPADEPANEVRSRLATSFVVYDSYQTRKLFEERWPILKTISRIAVATDSSTGSPFKLRRPANEFTLTRITRIAAVIGSSLSVLLVLIQFPSLRRVDSWLILASAIFLSLGLNISLAYLSQWVAPASVHWSSALLWIGGLLFVLFAESKAGVAQDKHRISFTWPSSRSVRLMLLYGVAVFALLFLVRLDFDGDFFNNWLPQARFHYLLGKHEPGAIITQGAIQAASYPPGYGIVLSTLMWVSEMKPTESFLIGPESSFAILLYRLFIFGLNAALLMLVIIYLRKRRAGQPAVWMAFVAVIMWLIPSTAGKHIASETVLFPMLAASIVLIAAGQNLKAPAMTIIGILVGGMATLIKWEAALIFALAVLPWVVSSFQPAALLSRAMILRWVGALALSLIPVVVWKTNLSVHNEFFLPVTWPRFLSSVHILPSLAGRAARGMLEDGRLLLILLALPGAVVVHSLSSRWATLLVPFGIASVMTVFVVIFLFANTDAGTYLDTSYSRLVMVPMFGAMLYCAEAIGPRLVARSSDLSLETAAQ
jgi:hypothetical protein